MISIAGIKYQNKLESLPYFTNREASLLIGKSGRNLDSKLAQLKKIGYLHSLKQNLSVTDTYLSTTSLGEYLEFMANTLRAPSYLSLEYVLAKHNFIPEGVATITSITPKSSRQYSNFLASPAQELAVDLRLNWEVFSSTDLAEFQTYVKVSASHKMSHLLSIIKQYVH